MPTSFVASVSSKTRRLIRHQDGLERWGLTKIPTAKIRAFAIANKGLAISSPKRSSIDQQKIGGFQKLNGFSAKMRRAMHHFKNGLPNADRVQKTIRTYGSSDAFPRLFVDR
jgi:hypothetical protein